jgi:hypothetical protein
VKLSVRLLAYQEDDITSLLLIFWDKLLIQLKTIGKRLGFVDIYSGLTVILFVSEP